MWEIPPLFPASSWKFPWILKVTNGQGLKVSRSVNFPHLAKNARYGAPEFVAGRILKI
jgi:hypothetical protein